MKKIFFLLIILIFHSCIKNDFFSYNYPKIDKKVTTENYFGKTINDDYRNLENGEDLLVRNWYKDQGDYTENIIYSISNRDEIVQFLKEIDSRREYYIKRLNIRGKKYFYLKKLPNESRYKLYKTQGFKSKEELIFDPNDFNPKSKNTYIINYINPSPNGRYVLISLTHSGIEYSEAVIYDLKLKKLLPQVIDHCWLDSFYGVDWLPDNSGFTYLHFPNLYDESKTSKHNSEAVLYKIGQDPKKLNIILSAKNNPELNLNYKYYPIVDIKNSDDKYIFAYMVNVGNYFDSYYARINELGNKKINWKPLLSKNKKVYKTTSILRGDSLYFSSAENAPNQKIMVLNMNDINTAHEIVPEKKDEVIKDFDLTKDGLFYTTLKNGVEAKLYKFDNKEINIKLPKESGYLSLNSKNKNGSILSMYMSGWLSASKRYIYDTRKDRFEEKDLRPSGKYPEFEDLVVKEIEVPSHDGVLIPLSIIHHKDIKLDGKNPVFMDGYGAYSENMSPYFSPLNLAWVAKGGIFATAHVRGGGEKGDSWHKAGMKTTKPNTWKDLIACMEHMVNNGYTSKKHNVIWSASAGGIMVGRAMIERPDLFKAVVSEVGLMNPLRSEESSSGTNYKEFGTVKDSIECMGLIEMDSYLNLKSDSYPATLVTAGMNDARVAPWESGKFIARLQELNTSNNPTLFMVYSDSGHGSGTTIEQQYQEWGNVFAFSFWQTGHPEFKLNKEAAFGNKKE